MHLFFSVIFRIFWSLSQFNWIFSVCYFDKAFFMFNSFIFLNVSLFNLFHFDWWNKMLNINPLINFVFVLIYDMDASEPKCVNSNYIWYRVNLLRLADLHVNARLSPFNIRMTKEVKMAFLIGFMYQHYKAYFCFSLFFLVILVLRCLAQYIIHYNKSILRKRTHLITRNAS